jgi:predicted Zn-dependent protease
MRILIALFTVTALASCDISLKSDDNHEAKTKDISYSYACLDSAVAGNKKNKTIDKATDLIRDFAFRNDSVTDEVQTEYGQLFHNDVIENNTFKLLKDPGVDADLERTLHDLLAVRESPSAIKYYIYALEDTAINAFTFGGRIYVTKAMYDRCKDNKALLYAIVGHEIGHSEKGHIKKTIQEMILANDIFGERNGATALGIKKLLTGSFNQKNELEADYYGTQLTYSLNQQICAAVSFWNEMSKQENKYNKVEDFFRTHPFSSLRAECLKNHIRTNYKQDCSASASDF